MPVMVSFRVLVRVLLVVVIVVQNEGEMEKARVFVVEHASRMVRARTRPDRLDVDGLGIVFVLLFMGRSDKIRSSTGRYSSTCWSWS